MSHSAGLPGHRRLRLSTVAALLLLAASAIFTQDVHATQFGVHMDLTFNGDPLARGAAIANARDVLHAQLARNSLLWDRIEPVPGVRDWATTDAVVSQLGAAGIEPLFVVYGSPAWASGVSPATPNARMYVPTGPAAFDRWLSRYADFMREAAQRYRGTVSKWEIGNEQNEHWFWMPGPNVDQYARFYTALRAAILAGNPDAQVAMGGLAGISATASADIPGLRFLQELNQRGVYPDRVALHPYTSADHSPDVHRPWQDNFDDIELVHRYLVSIGHPVPIWVTEWGWSSAGVGAATQARYVADSLRMIRYRYPYVTVATYFLDHDQGEYDQGLFDALGNPKPAALAFAGAISSPIQAKVQGATVRGGGPTVLVTAGARARRLVVRARILACPRCTVELVLRHRGSWRRVRMRLRGTVAVVVLRRLRRGRWALHVVAHDRGGRGRSRTVVTRIGH